MTTVRDTHITVTENTAAGVATPDFRLLNGTPATGESLAHSGFADCMRAANSCQPPGAVYGVSPQGSGPVRIGDFMRRRMSELRRRIGMYHSEIESLIAFSRELIAGPLSVGAVCPSSASLAQAMAGELRIIDDGLVLELGAGTGSITSALLLRGIAPERLIVVERSAALAAHLRQRFPAIRVIEGDARQLCALIGKDADRVCAVVSALPFRTMTPRVVAEITQQIRSLLPSGAVFVQFTYDLRKPSVCVEKSLKRERTRVVWRNLPPARVDTFIRQTDIA